MESYAKGPGGVCTPCGGVEFASNPSFLVFVGAMILCVVALVGVVAAIIVIRRRKKKSKVSDAEGAETRLRRFVGKVQMKLKIIVAFSQIAGSFRTTFSIPYPASYVAFMASMSGVVDFDLPTMLSLNCAVSIPYDVGIVLKGFACSRCVVG